jgi:hypothetical protein
VETTNGGGCEIEVDAELGGSCLMIGELTWIGDAMVWLPPNFVVVVIGVTMLEVLAKID